MEWTRFSDRPIAHAPRQTEGGTAAADVCRQGGTSEARFYVWKSKYGNLGVTGPRELRPLREENTRLKHLVWRI
jgi:putative transposase